ncbi:hypothetical protein NX722_19240 [Endozoicomonas gorgoniicola]|uniref:Uncharacterized protein n=1 Tax=Endozoicomonas gorgoniicola TaxID=1234144 RepID=A0ABT3MZA4_9GAMM|nr:hypothetical protein [Endozoicomonas gorgoniicola]MCW7554711.1 hypothetical protein [Endozoicomonas gorgoniicola]
MPLLPTLFLAIAAFLAFLFFPARVCTAAPVIGKTTISHQFTLIGHSITLIGHSKYHGWFQ